MPFGSRFAPLIIVIALIASVMFLMDAFAAKTESENLSENSSKEDHYKNISATWGLGYAVQETLKGAELAEYIQALQLNDYIKALQANELAKYLSAIQQSKQTKVLPAQSAAPTYHASSSSAAECIKQRESGGNYSINTGNGYYGAYQFLQSTWNSTVSAMGRSDLVGVRPSDASPADQDAAFSYLYNGGSGAGHWGGSC